MPNARLFKVFCSHCGKKIFRSLGRINESKKLNWKTYCSSSCKSKAEDCRVLLGCSRPKCNKLFKIRRSQLKRSELHFCSRSCAASVNNSRFPKRPAKIKICACCGKQFKSLAKYCSRACKDKGAIIGEAELIGQIKEFVKRRGRIPLKREFHHYRAIRGRFGTWNNAIKAAGFDPNPVMFANKHIAKDGHKCDSLAERIIDDWLYARKIEHQRSVPYPQKKQFTCDFVVCDHWIEFFGLYGQHKRYDELWRQKLELAKKYRLKLTEIYPEDLFTKKRFVAKLSFL